MEEVAVEAVKVDEGQDRAAWMERNERHKGQLDALDPEALGSKSFLVIGAGAIGSNFVAMLTKMGAKNVTVIDDDVIEEHNLSNQMYPEYALNMSKVDALADVCRNFSGTEITPIAGKFNLKEPGAFSIPQPVDYVISCVDSLAVRKDLWEYFKDRCTYFIDGRMALEVYRAYCIKTANEAHRAFYEDSLKGKPVEGRCTAKVIMYTVQSVSGAMLSMVKASLKNERCPVEECRDMRNFFGNATFRD